MPYSGQDRRSRDDGPTTGFPRTISDARTLEAGTAFQRSAGSSRPLSTRQEDQLITDAMGAILTLPEGQKNSILSLIEYLVEQNDRLTAQAATPLHQDINAFYDALTGIPNRLAFNEELKAVVSEGKGFSIAFIDLDDFKKINDTISHAAGDTALKAVADFLLTHTRDKDFVGLSHFDELSTMSPSDEDHMSARLGGDEFVLILKSDQQQLLEKRIADLQKEFDKLEFQYEGEFYPVKGSIGIAHCTAGMSVDECLEQYKKADVEMYARKLERKAAIAEAAEAEQFQADRFAGAKRFQTMINIFESSGPK